MFPKKTQDMSWTCFLATYQGIDYHYDRCCFFFGKEALHFTSTNDSMLDCSENTYTPPKIKIDTKNKNDGFLKCTSFQIYGYIGYLY